MHPADRSIAFLSFQLDGLSYGVEFSKVKELRTLASLERFAADGTIIRGVAVSRGVIMPIVDMRVASEGRSVRPDPGTDVIILQLSDCVMGMVVDGVSGVVEIGASQIAALPGESTGYLIGMAESGGRRLILIDIDQLMSIRRAPADAARRVA